MVRRSVTSVGSNPIILPVLSDKAEEVERRCRSLPFITAFWLAFLGTQIAHRQTRLEQSLHASMKDAFRGAFTPLSTAGCNASRRLVSAGGSGRSTRVTGLATVRSLDAVSNIQDLLTWLRQVLVPQLWLESEEGRGVFLSFGRSLGGVRVQQRRLGRSACPGNKLLQELYNVSCYNRKLTEEEVREENGAMPGAHVGRDGMMTVWLDLAWDEEEVMKRVDLMEERWFDAGTEVVSVQALLLFAQVHLMAHTDVTFHVDRIGRVTSSTNFMTLPTDVYDHGILVWIGDVFLVVLLLTLLLWEALMLYRAWRSERAYWDTLRALNWGMCLFGVGFSIFFGYLARALAALSDAISGTPGPPGEGEAWLRRHEALDATYTEVARLSYLLRTCELCTFWFSLVMLLKFFTVFEGSPRLAVVTATLRACAVDVLFFASVFLVVFVTFAVGAYFLFGHQLKAWSSIPLAVNSAFRTLMGDFSFSDMYSIAPVSATVWFWLFMCFIFLVMLNMLLTIVLETYANAKDVAATESTLWQQASVLKREVRRNMTSIVSVSSRRLSTSSRPRSADVDMGSAHRGSETSVQELRAVPLAAVAAPAWAASEGLQEPPPLFAGASPS